MGVVVPERAQQSSLGMAKRRTAVLNVVVVKLYSQVRVCRPAVQKNSRQTCPCLPGSSAEESPSLLSSSADRLTQPTPPRPFVEFTLRPAECSDWRDLNCSRLKRTPDSTSESATAQRSHRAEEWSRLRASLYTLCTNAASTHRRLDSFTAQLCAARAAS